MHSPFTFCSDCKLESQSHICGLTTQSWWHIVGLSPPAEFWGGLGQNSDKHLNSEWPPHSHFAKQNSARPDCLHPCKLQSAPPAEFCSGSLQNCTQKLPWNVLETVGRFLTGRLQIADCRLQIADFRWQGTARVSRPDCRFQIVKSSPIQVFPAPPHPSPPFTICNLQPGPEIAQI